MGGLPPNATIEDVLVRIRDAVKNPNVGKIAQAVLKPGPRTYRIATLWEIRDTNTGQTHHYSLKLDSVNKLKPGWSYKADKSITLEGKTPDEIEGLLRFLESHYKGELRGSSGDVRIIRSEDYDKMSHLVSLLPSLDSPSMMELLKEILPRLKDSQAYLLELIQAFKNSDADTVRYVAVASKMVELTRAKEQLAELVTDHHSRERTFQELLSTNPWMFGSEYSELLDRRTWTRDENLDFMLRRTADNYLEVIEIKTPFREPLFQYDKSHKSHYPSSKLSEVVGQVMKYIGELERNRDLIRSKDDYDTLKIRARIIIGRDGDAAHQEALRNYNAHLTRIEIVTFDQLDRIAARVLDIFSESRGPHREVAVADEDDDVPF